MPAHRDINALLQAFRNFLIGRKMKSALRFSDELARRDYPPPRYPPESHEKLSKNGYYMHDARSEMRPPIVVGGNERKQQIGESPEEAEPRKWPPIPGKPSKWDDHRFW